MKKYRNVIITGGRSYKDWNKVWTVLDFIKPDCVIHGCATGVDSYAGTWASSKHIEVIQYPAKWESEGRAAGPLRNTRMVVENPKAILLAFPGGVGTKNCVEQAKARGMIILRVEE